MEKNQNKKLVITGLLISMSIIISYLNPMIPIAGIQGMRISFSSYVSVIPAFLFGPVYGGISMGLIDVLSFLIRPEGAYMPLLTLTAVLKGVLIGAMYLWSKKGSLKILKNDYLKVFFCLFPVNVLITTINTKLIMMLYSINKAFIVFYTPRIIEELINIFIQSYIVYYLLKLSRKLIK